MARIYKRTDRIKVKIDDIVVTLAPLGLEQKSSAQSKIAKGHRTQDDKLLTEGMLSLIKYGLKDISGVVDGEDQPYKLTFDGEGLSDECLDDLMNLEMHPKLLMVCTSLATAIPAVFRNDKGEPIEGVEVLPRTKEAQDPNS